jgi:hypothetical protein
VHGLFALNQVLLIGDVFSAAAMVDSRSCSSCSAACLDCSSALTHISCAAWRTGSGTSSAGSWLTPPPQAGTQRGKPGFQHGADGIGRATANVLAHALDRGTQTLGDQGVCGTHTSASWIPRVLLLVFMPTSFSVTIDK